METMLTSEEQMHADIHLGLLYQMVNITTLHYLHTVIFPSQDGGDKNKAKRHVKFVRRWPHRINYNAEIWLLGSHHFYKSLQLLCVNGQCQRLHVFREMYIWSYCNAPQTTTTRVSLCFPFLCQEVQRAVHINDIPFIFPCSTSSLNAAPHSSLQF